MYDVKGRRCCFCGDDITHRVKRHNAAPVAIGACCESCNNRVVLPARLENALKTDSNHAY